MSSQIPRLLRALGEPLLIEPSMGQALARLLKQSAVDGQVRVTADRRGEVGVFLLGQTVMAEGLDGVARAHE